MSMKFILLVISVILDILWYLVVLVINVSGFEFTKRAIPFPGYLGSSETMQLENDLILIKLYFKIHIADPI